MDYIVTLWQEIASLSIVATTTVLLIRSELRRRRTHNCSTCSLADVRLNKKILYLNK